MPDSTSPHLAALLARLEQRKATIGVFGLGYVGLPLYLRFAAAGYRAIGFDIEPAKINGLKAGRTYLTHLDITPLAAPLAAGRCDVTSDFARVAGLDALILCVPTPLDHHRNPDLGFVIGSLESALPYLTAGTIVSLESTTYPGTTGEELQPRLEARGFTIGQDLFLVYSPEREDPGNPTYQTGNIPKVIGGVTAACLTAGQALYRQVIDQLVPVSSTRVAEMTKILENTYRAVNIALVNELKIVADKMDIDLFEVIRAAATKPFGYTPFYPGPGLGGHCIPIDPFYLAWKAKEYGIGTKFIELAGEVNTAMPAYVAGKIAQALNSHGKPLKGSSILLLGLAYKKNVNDTRETPTAELIRLLAEAKATVQYSDPHVPRFPAKRAFSYPLESVEVSARTLAQYDCVVVMTDHAAFDYDLVQEHARLIVDTRGIYRADDRRIFRS